MNLMKQARRIFAYKFPVDMRKGISGLDGLVRTLMQRDPLSGDIYVFVNRTGTHMKCLLWDRTGFIVIHKRLEHGKFRFHGQGPQLELDEARLYLLLDGIKVGGISTNSLQNRQCADAC